MERLPFNNDWYVTAETPGRQRPRVGPLSVPHDEMLDEDRDPKCANAHDTGYYPGGIYLYTK